MRPVLSALLACLLASGCASTVDFPSLDGSLRISGELHRPEAVRSVPAVVLLAPCYGVTPFLRDWAGWLKRQGYAALIVDSFASRNVSEACLEAPPSLEDVTQDALAGMNYLKTLPFVAADRIAVIGWSHGASAALALESIKRRNALPEPALIVAFYPWCGNLEADLATPTLLLLAGRDDWTPPEGCLDLCERMAREGRPLSWKLYPGATHSFDESDPKNDRGDDVPPDLRRYLGHPLAYDPTSARDAREQVRRFLARNL